MKDIVVYVNSKISANLKLPAFHLMRMLPCKRIRRTKLALGCAAKKINCKCLLIEIIKVSHSNLFFSCEIDVKINGRLA